MKPAIVLLAGGKGTRLRALDDARPKPMVPVGGQPFLHWVLRHYVRLGYLDFIISTGHLAEAIETHDWNEAFPEARFRFAREESPLGTGGATREVFARFKLERAWIVNADTLLPQPLPEPAEGAANLDALYAALEASELFDAKPNLSVSGGHVTAEGPGGTLFDGGAVLVTKAAIARYAGTLPCSLHQLLQPSMEAGRVGFARVRGTCYDIGTPERFRRFESYLANLSTCG